MLLYWISLKYICYCYTSVVVAVHFHSMFKYRNVDTVTSFIKVTTMVALKTPVIWGKALPLEHLNQTLKTAATDILQEVSSVGA